MPEYSKADLSRYRMEKAYENLETARLLLKKDVASSVNRSYYAIFHAIRALLILNGYDFKKHSAVIAKFRELYIKTGVFDKLLSTIAGNAFILRNDSDYNDFFVIAVEDAEQQLHHAEIFLTTIHSYLKEKIS